MASILSPGIVSQALPTHKDLPETDGSIVQNFLEHPQSILLTETIRPVLQRRHPDGQYAIGQDCGIYWRPTTPPLRGCKAPDWFYVPGVPPMLEGEYRRSYVLWHEIVAPLIILEFVSGTGAEERDQTPYEGKFWVYEQGIRAPYYGVYEVDPGRVEVYHLVDGRYELVPANERGHYPIAPLGVELGIWTGTIDHMELPWLRWWDVQGNLLPTGDERAEQERQRAETAEQRAKTAEQRAETAEQRAIRLAERLRALGMDPDEE